MFLILLVATTILHTLNGALHQSTNVDDLNVGRRYGDGGCPLCDSSVYTYCDFKMYHDACCCSSQLAGPGIGGPGCQFVNCQIFYAKSCYEHNLIRTCCCENPYQ